MRQLILQTMEQISEENELKNKIDSIFNLIEWLESDYVNFDKFFSKIAMWLAKEYKIRHVKIAVHNKSIENSIVIFHKGKEFDINDDLAFTHHIDLDEVENVFFSFCADNNEHQEFIYKHISYISLILNALKQSIRNAILYKDSKENALKDHITGLYNRVFLVEHLHKMLPLALREGKQIAFLMVGIDHFKAVIDEFDYKVGDKVLLALANTLKKHIRESDLVVRLDGDEFLVVLANVKDEDSTIGVALKLVQKFSEVEVDVNVYSGQKLKKTICVGISMYPNDSTSIDQILKNADISLYEARNLGRSKVLRFHKEHEGMVDLF
ncbi:MAG: GGDEF domain-containing protein [Arcobacteraceae bacterium]